MRKTLGMINVLKEVRVSVNTNLIKVNRTKFYIPAEDRDTTNIKHIKLIFGDFCKDELLKKCLDCKTQNQNQSFNNTVWNRLQKNNLCWVSSFFIRSL